MILGKINLNFLILFQFWVICHLLRGETHAVEFLALNSGLKWPQMPRTFETPKFSPLKLFYVICTDITFITGDHSQTITYNSILERLTLTAASSGWCAKTVAFSRKSLPTHDLKHQTLKLWLPLLPFLLVQQLQNFARLLVPHRTIYSEHMEVNKNKTRVSF